MGVKKSDPEISSKLCECGCGNYTFLARVSVTSRGYIKGEPLPFYKHHESQMRDKQKEVSNHFCECGCGKYTFIATRSDPRTGQIKGEPTKYYPNHNSKPRCKGKECRVEGCTREASRNEMCQSHDRRVRVYGDPDTKRPIAAKAPAGSGYINKGGYIEYNFGKRGGKVLAHRRVMEEEILKRPLRSTEVVHHRNGVKTDNRPENLELFTSSHPAGQRPADLLKWAYEFLEKYQDYRQ